MTDAPDPNPRLLTAAQVAARVAVSRRTLDRWIAAGTLPPPIRINRRLYWRLDDVNACLERLGR
jgi:excisionase family DNA binding protein